jgi:PTS system mannose-specific IIA component
MIGIVIVTHKQLGDALIDAADFILGGRPEAVVSVSIDINENAEKLRGKIVKGMKAVNQNHGILILTDMFGGTPSNLSYSFLEEGRVEVLSGVNLPILIKAVNTRDKTGISELAAILEESGKKSITLACVFFKVNQRR